MCCLTHGEVYASLAVRAAGTRSRGLAVTAAELSPGKTEELTFALRASLGLVFRASAATVEQSNRLLQGGQNG